MIFAWFEDKAAAMRWYDHPTHRRMRGASRLEGRDGVGGVAEVGGVGGEPMAALEDGVPVMAVACIVFDGPAAVPESPIPFSAISIELFTPVPGGLRLNGGFSPDGFVPDAPTTRPAE